MKPFEVTSAMTSQSYDSTVYTHMGDQRAAFRNKKPQLRCVALTIVQRKRYCDICSIEFYSNSPLGSLRLWSFILFVQSVVLFFADFFLLLVPLCGF